MTANCIHLFRADRERVARGWSAADARIRDTDTIHRATLPSVAVRGLAPCMYQRHPTIPLITTMIQFTEKKFSTRILLANQIFFEVAKTTKLHNIDLISSVRYLQFKVLYVCIYKYLLYKFMFRFEIYPYITKLKFWKLNEMPQLSFNHLNSYSVRKTIISVAVIATEIIVIKDINFCFYLLLHTSIDLCFIT